LLELGVTVVLAGVGCVQGLLGGSELSGQFSAVAAVFAPGND
jgi:hypothetical protein